MLATLLPVGGAEGARFVYRLLLHLIDFVRAAISARRRAMSWNEVLSGVLRLTLATDIMDSLIRRKLMKAEHRSSAFQAVLHDLLNSEPTWFETLASGIKADGNAPAKELDAAIQSAIANSESIRCIQLGRPESIVIGTHELVAEFHAHEAPAARLWLEAEATSS